MATTARPAPPTRPSEPAVTAAGLSLAGALPAPSRNPAAVAERRAMARMVDDPTLRAALFRFVDVRPACSSSADVGRHLTELLEEADGSPTARRAATLAGNRVLGRPVARVAAGGVRHMAHRFIVGADAEDALGAIAGLWRQGIGTTVDLLGEATVTEAEADRYAARCEAALRTLHAASASWPARPQLEADGAGALPRVNLSVKVSALTPLLRPNAPARGMDGARERLRHLLRVARDTGAHLHVDMESFDTREATVALTLGLLAEPSSPPARRPGSSCRRTCASPPSTSTSCWPGPARTRAPTRSRSAS